MSAAPSKPSPSTGGYFVEPNSFKWAEQLEDPKPVDVLKIFNCVLNTIENAVKDTKLAPVYDQYRAHLEEELDEMVVCIRDQIGSEQKQWVSFVISRTSSRLIVFFYLDASATKSKTPNKHSVNSL